MNSRLFLLLFISTALFAAPPTDPAAKKIYDHDYEWLSHNATNFIVTNIRGENDQQYRERRQAALDLLRERHDLTVVPELQDELSRGGFLSAEICDILGSWRSKRALPLLTQVAADRKRPPEVREKAEKAIWLIKQPVSEPARPSY